MRDADSQGLWASAAIGVRLIVGWACVAVGVLDLSMGLGPRPYSIFHAVLLAGGLLLLAMGKLPRQPGPIGYAVAAALAVLALALAALPRTSAVCCMRDLAIRHGYPLTVLAWDDGQERHFSAGHAVADLLFWCLAGLILLVAVTMALPRPGATATEAAGIVPPPGTTATAAASVTTATAATTTAGTTTAAATTASATTAAASTTAAATTAAAAAATVTGRAADAVEPARRATHAEDRAGAEAGRDRAADDENVGRLP